jgi:hypothetical protein
MPRCGPGCCGSARHHAVAATSVDRIDGASGIFIDRLDGAIRRSS